LRYALNDNIFLNGVAQREERSASGARYRFPSGTRICVPSSITGEQLEYFVPARIAVADFNSLAPRYESKSLVAASTCLAPVAAIVATRGRLMLSVDVIARTRSTLALDNLWFGKRLDAQALCVIHSLILGEKSSSSFRDSAVWVDGLRPKDAALIPCPSSMLPDLFDDYFAFMARDDVPHWIRLAIGHYQLLMIHPFFDGNGRLSRIVSLLHAQRFLTRVQAMAVAAALALQRRALRTVLDKMRQGDARSYLDYWLRLFSWSEVAADAIEHFGRTAKRSLAGMLDSRDTSHRFIKMVLDEPLFNDEILASRLNLSHKALRSKLDRLVSLGIVEPYVGNDKRHYRCPTAVEFWRQSMEWLASSCANTLADNKVLNETVTNPSP
jgi:Fic/DOC family